MRALVAELSTALVPVLLLLLLLLTAVVVVVISPPRHRSLRHNLRLVSFSHQASNNCQPSRVSATHNSSPPSDAAFVCLCVHVCGCAGLPRVCAGVLRTQVFVRACMCPRLCMCVCVFFFCARVCVLRARACVVSPSSDDADAFRSPDASPGSTQKAEVRSTGG